MDWTYSSTKKMEKLLKAIHKKSPSLYTALISAQERIIHDPVHAGKFLKGDLKDFMSYDFTFRGISIRICYAIYPKDKHVEFVYCGTRENFYKDVKNYLFH